MQARNSLALVGTAMAALALSGCGQASTGDASSNAAPTLSGLVSSDAPSTSVELRDASDPARIHITTPAADGSFSFDATGLAPPFVLRAEGVGPALYTIVLHSGNADINGLTSAAVSGAMGGRDAGEAWSRWGHGEGDDGEHEGAGRIGSVIRSLRTVLKPLFDLYHVDRIGGDDDEGDVSGMRALLRDVSFTVSNRIVTVTNRATGGVIFSGPLNDLASGVFHPENMPAGPGGTPTPPPPPAACTYTYGAWGACQPEGTQTRTLVSATPAGCTGTPVLSRSCTPTPPPPATCTGFTYSAWTPATCPASGQQTRTVLSSTPAGCTGGNPVLAQTCTPPPPPPVTCTGFTYSAWTPATCPASGQQTRTVVSSAPAGCTGGNPVLTQACTPPPPIDGAALYTQYCSGCHGNAKKGSSASAIKAAIDSNRGGMGTAALRALTPEQIQAISTAP